MRLVSSLKVELRLLSLQTTARSLAPFISLANLWAELPYAQRALLVRWLMGALPIQQVADLTGGHLGTILTVAGVTGTAEQAEALIARFPDAVAEGMEGAGVAAAAALHGVAFAELRAISNLVGPRDRDAWRIADALTALRAAVTGLAAGWTT